MNTVFELYAAVCILDDLSSPQRHVRINPPVRQRMILSLANDGRIEVIRIFPGYAHDGPFCLTFICIDLLCLPKPGAVVINAMCRHLSGDLLWSSVSVLS